MATQTQDESTLAEMGYKQELRRDWSMLHNFGISFSVIVCDSKLFCAYPVIGMHSRINYQKSALIFTVNGSGESSVGMDQIPPLVCKYYEGPPFSVFQSARGNARDSIEPVP
ncbi:hypothetical protein MMC30_002662 [Trapelia coarctata]|nr:hypothetical protein [Trapelia coarctata]